jgi:hypothetical protein
VRAFLSLAVLLGLAASASAAGLEQIDRTIRQLPALRSKTPRYCLLAFGPEAKTRVWAVVDDTRLYIDLNGNGDLTEPGETIQSEHREFTVRRFTELDGTATHTDLRVIAWADHYEIEVLIHGRLPQRVFRDVRGKLTFGVDARTAPIVHLNGPVTLDSFWVQRPLSSARPGRLSVVVGTHGVGPGTFAIYECDCFLRSKAAPEADIEFPHRDPGQPPLLMHVKLDRD